MKFINFNINNYEINGNPWITIEAIVDIESDFFKKVKSQAQSKIHFSPNPSQSGNYRSLDTKYQNQLRGGLAEAYSKLLIEEFASLFNIKVEVIRYDDVLTSTTGFTFDTIKGEYDIKVLINGKTKLLESRSSVAHNISLKEAIQKYDTIGRYTSFKKPDESFNDFYIRPLYEYVDYSKNDFYSHDFENLIRRNKIVLHFTGGADLKMMESKGYNKSMGQGSTVYRVIKITDGYTITDFLKRLLDL
jgi:hypothetical protein